MTAGDTTVGSTPSGAVAGGVGELFTGVSATMTDNTVAQGAAAALGGGIGSALTGGKFGDGFALAAAGYLLNDSGHANAPNGWTELSNGIFRVFSGDASFYDSPPGAAMANGQGFDPNAMNAAMTREKAPLGSNVSVTLQDNPSQSIDVTVTDRGPFAVNAQGQAIFPLQPNPTRVIDLTPAAFRALTGSLGAGHVPVSVLVPP